MAKTTPSEFIATLLNGVTMAHMHHFMVTGPGSYAKHMALNDLYNDLQDATDELAEAFIGCASGEPLKFKAVAGPDLTSPVADVEALYQFVEYKRDAMGEESHIQNQVDEICSIISRALYKLRRLA